MRTLALQQENTTRQGWPIRWMGSNVELLKEVASGEKYICIISVVYRMYRIRYYIGCG